MNASTNFLFPKIANFTQGGYFHGIVLLDGKLYGETTAPKAGGQVSGLPWLANYADVLGAASDFDGLANTLAMAEAGSPLAQAALACRCGGFDDWYLPARGGLLQQWALQNALPTEEKFAHDQWYWSSTQYSRNGAFAQGFDYGNAYIDGKSWACGCARFVRRFLIE